MSFDFTSDSGATHNIRTSGWTLLLYAAEDYGWAKADTLPPEGVDAGEWDGGYASNEGQYVTKAAALDLAMAFERLLADPNRAERVRATEARMDQEIAFLLKRDYGIEQPPRTDAHVYPISEPDLQEFIAFCRKGGFRIE